MQNRSFAMAAALALCTLAYQAGLGRAEQVRIRYYPQDSGASTTMKTATNGQPVGVRVSGLGFRREPYHCLPKYNCTKTFCHKVTGQQVTVPLWLPPNTPTIFQTWTGTQFNYGSFAVDVNFLADGTVEVVYDNGLL